MPDRNIKITLQYDGSRYDGWQKQGNTDKTIQGKLEQILENKVWISNGYKRISSSCIKAIEK